MSEVELGKNSRVRYRRRTQPSVYPFIVIECKGNLRKLDNNEVLDVRELVSDKEWRIEHCCLTPKTIVVNTKTGDERVLEKD